MLVRIIGLVFVLLMAVSINAKAQQSIELELQNAPKGYMYLQKISGDNHIKIDSAKCINNHLVFTGKFEPGMYYINQGLNAFSFLVNEKRIRFLSDFAAMPNHLKVVESRENKIWFKYLKKRDEMFQKIKMLKPITVWYDKGTEFHKQAVREYNNVQALFHDFIRTIPEESMAFDYAMADVKPKLKAELSFKDQKDELKPDWFAKVNWQQTALINSDILTNKLKDFLGLYNQRGLNRKQLEEEFKVAVEQILPFAVANEKVGKFVVEFLLKEFERFGLDEVIVHVADIYASLGTNCEMEGSESELQVRLKKYEQMSIGKIAPNLLLPNLKGELFNLKDNLGEKNLVVFWSSWCPHCLQLMPQFKKWYVEAEKQGWQLITVSLDKERQALEKVLDQLKPNFPVLCDFKKWESQAAKDFNIHSTPCLIVLDEKGKIVSKPNVLGDLQLDEIR